MGAHISAAQKPVIQVEHIDYTIHGNHVLSDLSFTINEGDYVGLLGPNGSGKTTLLRIILGLLQPETGNVKLFDTPLNRFVDYKSIGYVPQRASRTDWDFPATVYEVVKSGRTIAKRPLSWNTATDAKVIQEAMDTVDITDLKNRNIADLSGGERQRVFIARALAAEPRVLILDEPTTGVDITVQHEFYAFLKRLNQEKGMTIVLVSHDIDAITHETKSVLCINRSLVCHMPTREFLDSKHMEELFGHNATHIYHEHSDTENRSVEEPHVHTHGHSDRNVDANKHV